MPPTPTLRDLYGALQAKLQAALQAAAQMNHPTDQGTATEDDWLRLLNDFIPKRYAARKATVLDSVQAFSDNIDVVIHDRQYSPLLFEHQSVTYIPAESVYAVFEVKQRLNAGHIKYAGEKAASVRNLLRTTVPIPHAGGVFQPKPLQPILAGILTTGTDWAEPLGSALEETLGSLDPNQRLDLGCSVTGGTFEAKYEDGLFLSRAPDEVALASFLIRLLSRLQELGTVPAIDLRAYLEAVGD